MRTYSPALQQFDTDANNQFAVPWEIQEACRSDARWTSAKAKLRSPRPWSWSFSPSRESRAEPPRDTEWA